MVVCISLIFGNPLNDTLGECTDAENEKTSDEVLPVSEGLYLNNNNKASVSALTDILVGLLKSPQARDKTVHCLG